MFLYEVKMSDGSTTHVRAKSEQEACDEAEAESPKELTAKEVHLIQGGMD